MLWSLSPIKFDLLVQQQVTYIYVEVEAQVNYTRTINGTDPFMFWVTPLRLYDPS